MFSQNVFSAKDVFLNSKVCDPWDSKSHSQFNSYSQNSQLSSMELFSQQKGSNQAKFDQYQRSQSQTTDKEPSNYYSKYLNNPLLFHGLSNSKNNQTKSIKDIIEDQKRNISIREERDLLQTFVNLLKDYTKEVDSTFQNFKDYMENSFQEVTKSVIDGAKDFDNNFKTLKQELFTIIEKTEKESSEKQELQKDLLEQTGTIKVLKSKIEWLENQLNEANNKETEYADLKKKFYQLEKKCLQGVTNFDYGQSSLLGNTPPPSQGFLVPPLRQEGSMLDNFNSGNYQLLPNQVPLLATSYGLEFWDPGKESGQSLEYNYNPQIMNSFQIDSKLHPPPYIMSSNVVPSTTNCLYPPRSSTGDYKGTMHVVPRNTITHAQQQQQQQKWKELGETQPASNSSHQHGSLQNSGSKSGLIVTRRSGKRLTQSPMAMVRPQVRCEDHAKQNDEDELSDIFISSVKDSNGDARRRKNTNDSEWINGSLNTMKVNGKDLVKSSNPPHEQKSHDRFKCNKAVDNNDITKKAQLNPRISAERMLADDVHKEVNKESKRLRRVESVRRKRSLVSMLGTSSDDLEVQEIANSIKAQQPLFYGQIKGKNWIYMKYLYPNVVTLVYLNSLLNPIIYCLRNQNFARAILKMICFHRHEQTKRGRCYTVDQPLSHHHQNVDS